MSNAQIAKTIKEICKLKEIPITKILNECNIRKSLIYDLEKRDYTPSVEILEKIADYLDCSVDYLLGRVDTPNGIYSINGDNNVQVNGNNSPTNVTSSKNIKQDNMIEEFMQSFEKLDFADKVSVMSFTMSKINK